MTGFPAAHFGQKINFNKTAFFDSRVFHYVCVFKLYLKLPDDVSLGLFRLFYQSFLPVKPGNFLEVKNQEANTVNFPYKFTVCLSTMFNFTNVLQVTSLNGRQKNNLNS